MPDDDAEVITMSLPQLETIAIALLNASTLAVRCRSPLMDEIADAMDIIADRVRDAKISTEPH